MPFICYQEKSFRADKLELIEKINEVINDYTLQGYTLTLRQLYYQLVARGIIENNMRSYKNTGNLINDARLAGLIDWKAIEDRTRNLKRLSHWESPQEIIEAVAYQYRKDLWEDQDYYIEVWVEKEALAEVVGNACKTYDVPYFCCRGYVSQSEMWEASQRLIYQCTVRNKDCLIIHLGDHDPSGIDMSRDIEERLQMFGNFDSPYFNIHFQGLRRIALNMNQIEEFNPPPNPAKLTDSRCKGYMNKYGDESWELDALEPRVITNLIHETLSEFVDFDKMNTIQSQVDEEKKVMEKVAEDWNNIFDKYQ